MSQVVLVFPVWFAGSSGQGYASIAESARSRYIPSLSPKLIALHYYFSSMRNNFSFILVASEANGLPKTKSVVKLVEDTFR
jgi:hypothetical protein